MSKVTAARKSLERLKSIKENMEAKHRLEMQEINESISRAWVNLRKAQGREPLHFGQRIRMLPDYNYASLNIYASLIVSEAEKDGRISVVHPGGSADDIPADMFEAL